MTRKYVFILEATDHAELSASSAERWLTCPGSVALSAGVPNMSSEFAAEGTAAHHIGAEALRAWRRGHAFDLRANCLGKVALVEGFEINLDEELLAAVEEYVQDCVDDYKPGDVILIEQSFTPALKRLHPKFGGSSDYVRWRPSTRALRSTDYKHGSGVPVDVDDNKQLKKYALGALLENPMFNAEDVELRIAQPRCDHEQGRFRSYIMPAMDLLDFAADLIEGAQRTEEFGAELVPSKKACRFCPANRANKCPAIEKATHALIAADFTPVTFDPQAYSVDQIAEFLDKAPLVEARISAVREFAYQQACTGVKFPGQKLVDKRPTRKWADEEAAKKAVGLGEQFYTTPELRSPAQIEKLLGKKKFNAKLNALVAKVSSGLTLVKDTDPRPEAQRIALTDFTAVPETTPGGDS